VTVFEAAMGPMIGAAIVGIDHELDPPLLTLMVGVGIPLSFLTLPVWLHLLSFLRPQLALNVSAGTARFRQLSEAVRKTYARREFFSP